jgi:hypothetical protein
MRVVVRNSDPKHHNAGPFAYRLGRIQDGVDTVTGEDRSAQTTVNALLEAAKNEYAEAEGYIVSVERLITNEAGDAAEWVHAKKAADGTRWIAEGEPAPPGKQSGIDMTATTGSAA